MEEISLEKIEGSIAMSCPACRGKMWYWSYDWCGKIWCTECGGSGRDATTQSPAVYPTLSIHRSPAPWRVNGSNRD